MTSKEPNGKSDTRGTGDMGPIGQYSNFFKVGHSAFEFVLDFGQSYSEDQAEQYHTRIIISPFYARILVKLLRDSINKHEHNFGPIPYNNEIK
ncbi:DUF3467 domain-containing protein [Candidatus Nitrospira salsa]